MNVGVTIGGGDSGLSWRVVSVNTNAEGGKGYITNTTSGSITLTLPASPVAGDQIGVSDYDSGFSENNCILSRNGNKIMGWKILYGV